MTLTSSFLVKKKRQLCLHFYNTQVRVKENTFAFYIYECPFSQILICCNLLFAEGTYLFLRPNVRISSVLSNRKLTEHELSSMSECRWTMTGPNSGTEYPARYMTPKTGSPGYNEETRGVLYSRKDQYGNDDIYAKILHVYRSVKVSRRGKQSAALPQDAPPAKVVDSNGPKGKDKSCLLYTSPSPRDLSTSRMPSSA